MSIRSFVLWAVPVSTLFMMMVVTFLSPISGFAAEPAPPEGGGQKAFDIRIAKGQYYFTALGNTGQKNVIPLSGARYMVDADLKITIHPGVSEDGDRVWLHDERFECVLPAGSPFGTPTGWRQSTLQDRVGVKEGNAMADVPPTLEDISKLAGIGGVQIYRIPYAEVAGETRFILVVLSSTPESIAAIITLPQTQQYAKHSWAQWIEIEK